MLDQDGGSPAGRDRERTPSVVHEGAPSETSEGATPTNKGLPGAGGQRTSVPASADVGESTRSDTCEQWQAERHPALRSARPPQEVRGEPGRILDLLKNGHILDDKQAYKLFDSLCAHRFARAFKLYKLYERAAAFVGHPAE